MRTTSTYNLTQYDGSDSPKWLEPAGSAGQTPENSSAGSYTRDMRVIGAALDAIKALANSALNAVSAINTRLNGLDLSGSNTLPGSKVGTGAVNGLSTDNYKDGSVTGIKVGTGETNGLGTTNYKNLSVTTEKLGEKAVTGGLSGKIALQTVTLDNLAESATSAMGAPAGSIMMWPSPTPPSGWELCIGTVFDANAKWARLKAAPLNLTALPDLRGRFPLGFNNGENVSANTAKVHTNLSDTGGLREVALAEGEMPSHAHVLDAHSHYETADHLHEVPSHTHLLGNSSGNANDLIHSGGLRVVTGGSGTEEGFYRLLSSKLSGYSPIKVVARAAFNTTSSRTGNSTTPNHSSERPSMGTKGSGNAHTNLPPFVSLNFIIKL